jgi:hypothetical protein
MESQAVVLTKANLDFDEHSSENEVVKTAVALYDLGINVIPVIHPRDLQILSVYYPNRFTSTAKHPYLLEPFFYSRLHLCGKYCQMEEDRTGKKCEEKNENLSFHSLFSHSNLGVMLGRTSGNLTHVDCDDHKQFVKICNEFKDRNISFLGYTSGRGGGLLFRAKEGEINNVSKTDFENVQIWGNKRCSVIPPSLHSTGAYYGWLPGCNPLTDQISIPLISTNQLSWLSKKLDKWKPRNINLYDLPDWTRILSQANRDILANGASQGERNSQLVNPIYEIAYYVQNNEVAYQEAIQVINLAANRCKPPYLQHEAHEIFKSASHKKRLTSTHEFYEYEGISILYQKALAFAQKNDWTKNGRSGYSDQIVFLACAERMKMENSKKFRASLRELSELSGCKSINTVQKAIARLREKMILIKERDFVNQAHYYSINPEVLIHSYDSISHCNTSVSTMYPPKTVIIRETNSKKDIFMKLGKLSLLVYNELESNPHPSPGSIAKSLNRYPVSIRRVLHRLIDIGLVRRSSAEGQFYIDQKSEEEFREIAHDLGAEGQSALLKARHERERQIRNNSLLFQSRQRINQLLDQANVDRKDANGQ